LAKEKVFIMNKKIKFIASTELTYITEDPPVTAKSFIPEWFKNIPLDRQEGRDMNKKPMTVKGCIPFMDAMTTGYMLCMPQDLEFRNENGIRKAFWGFEKYAKNIWEDNEPVANPEPSYRTEGIAIPNEYEQELWRLPMYPRVETPPGYSILVTHPFNRFELPFITFTGIIDTDLFNGTLVATIAIRKDFNGVVKKGTPVAQLMPFKRDNWVSEILPPYSGEIVEKKSFDLKSTIKKSYQLNYWKKKKYED